MSTPAKVLGLSERQMAMRQRGLGASEVARVVGLVPGAIEVWERKVGLAPEQAPSDLTEFGHRIEDVVADAYHERHPQTRLWTPGTLVHPKHPWALATPDRVEAPPGVGRPARSDWMRGLEIKWAAFSAADYADGPPERHVVQCQWQMEVAGLDQVVLVALVNGAYREFPLDRDRELGAMLLELAGRWWTDHVLARTPPPVDGSDAYAAYLRRRYPADQGELLAPTPEAEELVRKVRALKAEVRAVESGLSTAEQELKTLIGDAPGFAGLVTWRANKASTVVDWQGVARNIAVHAGIGPEEFDKVVASQSTQKPGARVLRLSKETP